MQVFLRIVSLQCLKTQDRWGEDEPYLQVDGKKVWSGNISSSGESTDLTDIETIPFYENTRLELWEEDTSSDDLIGKEYIPAIFAGKGEQELIFTGGGRGKYRLTFEVLKKKA